jgi:hypothetical protein
MVSPVETKILQNQVEILGYSNGIVAKLMVHLHEAVDDLTKKL